MDYSSCEKACTEETRETMTRYLAEITYYDWQVGQALELLDKHGVADNTLVIVVSEQGSAFPVPTGQGWQPPMPTVEPSSVPAEVWLPGASSDLPGPTTRTDRREPTGSTGASGPADYSSPRRANA